MRDFVVVGAGLSGLAVAAELAAAHSVTVVDRAAIPGGVLGPHHEYIDGLTELCRRRDVDLQLTTTGVRWNSAGLHTVRPTAGLIAARHLVVATGMRPSTAAELGIVGTRPAGVIPTPSALQLLRDGVVLGRRVVVVGAGWSAAAVAEQIVAQGATVVQLPVDSRIVEFIGRPRVSAVSIEDDGRRRDIACDAVILADDMRPRRNLDGAIASAPNTTHLPASGPGDAVDAIAKRARSLAHALIGQACRAT